MLTQAVPLPSLGESHHSDGALRHTRWADACSELQRLTQSAAGEYKLVYVARHAQGYHNVAEQKYGTPAWNARWAREYGDGVMTWGPDPELTDEGVEQAEQARAMWRATLQEGAPLPERLFCSPLRRALDTQIRTWRGLLSSDGSMPAVHVSDGLREVCGVHTCDQRSSRADIERRFPETALIFDADFVERDEMWKVRRSAALC